MNKQTLFGLAAAVVVVLVLVVSVMMRPGSIFTTQSVTTSGNHTTGDKIPLATFTIAAKDADLDGSTFRVGSTFSRSEDFESTLSTGLRYDCPDVIPAGTTATCTAYVGFITPGYYFFKLQDLSIEKVGATDYEPIVWKGKVGEGVLTIQIGLNL